jgi:outer membrane protein TolC
VTEWNEIQRRVERRPLTPEVISARIELRVAELRVLAARTSILAARAHHVPSDIWFASKADVARAIATAIEKRKQR